MPGYMIYDLEILDPAAWEDYRRQAGPLMAAAGGRFLAAMAAPEPLDGAWRPATLSVVEFPSLEAARTFYRSPQYQAMLPLRDRAARGSGVLVEGHAAPEAGG